MILRNIKSASPTLKLNYLLIPVTTTDSIQDFNDTYFYWKEIMESQGIKKGFKRTKSGGISLKGLQPIFWDIKANANNGCELIVNGIDINEADESKRWCCFRLKYGTSSVQSASGHKGLLELKKELKKDKIDLEDYYIDNGKELRTQSEKPIAKSLRQSYNDIVFDNVHCIDLTAAYPSAWVKLFPEWLPAVKRLTEKKNKYEKGTKEYDLAKSGPITANGYMGSVQYFGAKLAQVYNYSISYTNQRLAEMEQFLIEHDCMPLRKATDAIWFVGDYHCLDGILKDKELGEWHLDHKNCTYRSVSDGIYEYIEDGKYHIVRKGLSTYDLLVPREQQQWGDAYKGTEYKLIFDEEKGICKYETQLDKVIRNI